MKGAGLMVKVGGVHVHTHWLIVACGVVCHLNTHTSVGVVILIDRFLKLALPPAYYSYHDNY